MSKPKAPKKTRADIKADAQRQDQLARDEARLKAEEAARRARQAGSSLLIGGGGETGISGGPQPSENKLGVY